jgi:peroxiredoxin
LQAVKDEFEKLGATIIAITPQLPQFSKTMIDQNELGFDLLTDNGNEYAEKLGLKFKLPDDLTTLYQQFGIDLPTHNDEPSWTLPMPGRFISDSHGIVRSVAVDPDYTHRPEPAETLAALKNLPTG